MKYALIIHNFNQYGRSLTRFASLILLFAAMLSCGHESEVNKHKEVSHSAETGSDEIVKALVDELNQIDVGTDGEQVFSPPAIKLMKLGPRAAWAIAPQLNQPDMWRKIQTWLILGQIVRNTYDANSQSPSEENSDEWRSVMDSFDFALAHTPEQNSETVRRVIEWANRQIADIEKVSMSMSE